ncbi:MAG: hypothetical protein ACTS22_00150 [Phycisphaerales bacterium]
MAQIPETVNPRIAELLERLRSGRVPASASGKSSLEKLRGFDVASLRDTLLNWEATEQQVDDAITWVLGLAHDVDRVVGSIDNDEDAMINLAVKYIELKSRWIGINNYVNYTMMRGDRPNDADVLRGAAVSQLLATIEDCISPSDIETITEFLAEPIGHAA